MRLHFLLPLLATSAGCGVLKGGAKYRLADGVYVSQAVAGTTRVWVSNTDSAIRVYGLRPATGWAVMVDSATMRPRSFGEHEPDTLSLRPRFRQASFDVDVLTIPFKYRFGTEGFPRQFTTQFNGGVYLGYRSDVYALHYDRNPLGLAKRRTAHYGLSLGGFTGLGSTAMNPWVTRNQITIEYEGVSWSKGVAAIVGLNNLTAGLALGWDHLLDANRRHWIYQGRPWVGVVFGLNVN